MRYDRLAILTNKRGSMYGLPKDIDLSFFCGKELIRVAVGPYDVQLHFYASYKSASVCCQSRIEHCSKDRVTVWEGDEHTPMSASSLLTLLGSSVTAAHGVPDGTLTLEFSNGDKVRVFDREGYEAYQIHHEDKLSIEV